MIDVEKELNLVAALFELCENERTDLDNFVETLLQEEMMT
jgi:hypothetical protein